MALVLIIAALVLVAFVGVVSKGPPEVSSVETRIEVPRSDEWRKPWTLR
ncbi:MAG: hypothetical protein AB1405_03590 [Bdellovibrionota bacterium]